MNQKDQLESKSEANKKLEKDLLSYKKYQAENEKLNADINELKIELDKAQYFVEEQSISLESMKETNEQLKKEAEEAKLEATTLKNKYERDNPASLYNLIKVCRLQTRN